MLDCFDGSIHGFAMVKHMQAELCVEALENACRSNSVHGLILHSDRGSHFTCRLFRAALRRHEIRQSMSGTGCCYDNTRMESFFATLQNLYLLQIYGVC